MVTKDSVKVDTITGSRTYNRLDMQVSQTLHMAIELFDNLNYLFILDHYDDITLFDLDKEPLVVSYYQLKTSNNERITIDSAISENWLAKLYSQLNRSENWLIKELGLITNTPLEIRIKKDKQKQTLSADKTSFAKINKYTQNRIRKDIAVKFGISEDKVDLSKFFHLRTTLSIERHKDIVESEIETFLYDKYPRITVDTVKGIYSSLVEILTKRQAYELLPNDAGLLDAKKHKGFTKTEFINIIDKAIILSLPTFEDVVKLSGVEESTISLPYVQILTDSNKRDDESFHTLFNKVLKTMNSNPFSNEDLKTVWEYGLEIGNIISENNSLLTVPYNSNYIAVLVICLLINKSRRL